MGVKQITVNGKAVFDAIAENSIHHVRNSFFENWGADGKPQSACVLGVAALNLGVAAESHYAKNAGADLVSQLNEFTVPRSSPWYVWDSGNNGIGDTIIYWNDKVGVRLDGTESQDGYVLSWPEVVGMARELLTPHFGDLFTVDVWEWDGFGPDKTQDGYVEEPDDDDYDYPEPGYDYDY